MYNNYNCLSYKEKMIFKTLLYERKEEGKYKNFESIGDFVFEAKRIQAEIDRREREQQEKERRFLERSFEEMKKKKKKKKR